MAAKRLIKTTFRTFSENKKTIDFGYQNVKYEQK